ncbi:E3 ubiquitin-protein ligase rnf6 [Phtheirospermum japonicum]|uniref:E3 ubiquitin-protein ligase rnf6 n=2 Tax=Phtheirospermum japonicum TaxID=374723 RepID=A0A830CEI6_9LAMI|nr:E3 ubiquitin-protein ligase rnf6 [Phtheirospermum japonicum]
MVDLNELNYSKHKSKRRDGVKTFLLEFRTNFILKTRPRSEEEKKEKEKTYYRLGEYWMSKDELRSLLKETLDFLRKTAADPQHAPLNPIPVVVHLDVCTVQQEGESFGAAKDRAIRAEYLVPLYLWQHRMTLPEFKAMHPLLRMFIRSLDRVRVGNADERLALMKVCSICSRDSNVGAQITPLPTCGHAFHSHCILPWLEENNLCPSCRSPAYDPWWSF